MPITDEKVYLLDGKPISPRNLIQAAADIDERFANDWMKSTSEAARILRENGQSVEDTRHASL